MDRVPHTQKISNKSLNSSSHLYLVKGILWAKPFNLHVDNLLDYNVSDILEILLKSQQYSQNGTVT